MKINIRKITISNRSLKVTYQKNQTTKAGDISDEISIKCGALLHDDFFTALDNLKIHFAALCDFREVVSLDADTISFKDFRKASNLDNVYITGLQLGGDKEDVEIMGGKMKGARCINMVSPKVNIDDTYIYLNNLYEAIEGVKNETHEYLFNEKYAIKQMALDFEAENEYQSAEEQIPESVEGKPKRGGGRAKKIKNEVPQSSTVN